MAGYFTYEKIYFIFGFNFLTFTYKELPVSLILS